ncbi:MAG: rubredoxin [bacterium]
MERYQCGVCGWIYDEVTGYPEGGIPAGNHFADLPESWTCPFCNHEKDQFKQLESE